MKIDAKRSNNDECRNFDNKMSQRNNTLQHPLNEVIETGQEACCRDDSSVHLVFKGIYIWHSKDHEEIKDRFKTQSPTPFLQMIFCIHGNERRSVQDTITIEPESNRLFFVPADTPNHLFHEMYGGAELMGVHVEMPLFFNLLPKDNGVLDSFKEKTNVHQVVKLSSSPQPLTIGMKEVIHQILRCLRTDDCRCLFFHAKVVELLSLQLEQLEAVGNESASSYQSLKEEELKRVYRVKKIIEQDSQKKFSLLGLAHAVGTNDATLKKHFKAVFGITVFGYLHAYRMEQAKRHLIAGDLKISVIAQQSGYKHATHFSAAFKKYFGYLPTQVK